MYNVQYAMYKVLIDAIYQTYNIWYIVYNDMLDID